MNKEKIDKHLHIMLTGKQQKFLKKVSFKTGQSAGFIVRFLIDELEMAEFNNDSFKKLYKNIK